MQMHSVFYAIAAGLFFTTAAIAFNREDYGVMILFGAAAILMFIKGMP